MPQKEDLLKNLTEKQKEAVKFKKGPALVVAGAGTGKTTVITRRIAWLIQNGFAKPSEILALTFTEKAANEMITRVDEITDFVYSDLNISTFHSFGADLITEYAFDLGIPADFRVLTDVEQVLFIRDHIFDFKLNHFQSLSEPTSVIRELVSHFSRLKDEAIAPDSYLFWAKKNLKNAKDESEKIEAEKTLELASAYEVYQKLLRAEGYIDFGDQIMLLFDLLGQADIKKKIKGMYKYVLVDEFQDTNFAQSEVIYQIFGENGNVMVVGDDDQSIYKFRGAAVSNILDFRERYKNVRTIVLNDNFRSTQKILDAAYKLIQNNNPERLEQKYKITKKLKSYIGDGVPPELMLFTEESQEAEKIAEKIIELHTDGTPFNEIALLVRSNSHADEFVKTLKKHGIPFIFSGAAGLYEKQEVKLLVALTNALFDSEDDLAFFHLAASEAYNINADELSRLMRWAERHNQPLSKAMANLKEIAKELNLSRETIEKGLKLNTDASMLREEAKTATAGEIINLFLRHSGYYKKLTTKANQGSPLAYQKIANIASFFDKIIHFQRNYRDHSLEKFGQYLKLIIDAGDDPATLDFSDDLEAVNVLTVHKSKGLEFEVVFLASLSDSHFPGRGHTRRFLVPEPLSHQKKSKEDQIAEERRLFYVAATRAKKKLYLSASLDYGTKKSHKLSRFVTEMLGTKNIKKEFLKSEYIDKIRHFEKIATYADIKIEPYPKNKILEISRAAIDDWLTCPFKYQLIHITPIRLVADANVAYGNAIHNTIGEYLKNKINGKKISLNQIFEWFDLFWDETGFLSKRHEEERYKNGKIALKKFFIKQEQDILPKLLEQKFKFVVERNAISGRYDAVYDYKGKIRIVDFKTSSVKTQKEADERTKKSTQLATYALAWQKNYGKLPDEVSLYFIDSGLVGLFRPDARYAQKTEQEIVKACQGIRNREFTATPSLMTCKYCPYNFYCPKAVREKTTG